MDPNAPKPRREKKEAFRIDFLTPAEQDLKETAKILFAPVTRGAGITLPDPSAGAKKTGRGRKGTKAKKDKEEKRCDHTLPDDMHFSSRQLVTLFLKPKFSVSSAVNGSDPNRFADLVFSCKCEEIVHH